MSQPLPLQQVSALTRAFLAAVLAKAPCRLEAKVASQDGMPLLCAVEAVLGAALPSATAQEMVWLSRAPAPGRHVLRLLAYAPDNVLLGEAVHELGN
jgi:hypothetical protein